MVKWVGLVMVRWVGLMTAGTVFCKDEDDKFLLDKNY